MYNLRATVFLNRNLHIISSFVFKYNLSLLSKSKKFINLIVNRYLENIKAELKYIYSFRTKIFTFWVIVSHLPGHNKLVV